MITRSAVRNAYDRSKPGFVSHARYDCLSAFCVVLCRQRRLLCVRSQNISPCSQRFAEVFDKVYVKLQSGKKVNRPEISAGFFTEKVYCFTAT
jgi:hypothetical protein